MRTIFLLFIVLYGCGKKSALIFDDGSVSVSPALIRSVSYKEIKEKVFDKSCIGCHGDSGGINLESYTAAYQHLEGIKQTVLLRKNMPKAPYKNLSRTQLEIVTAWIEAGGPDKPLDGSDPGETEETELKPTFASIKNHILDKKCMSCHSAGNSAARIPLSTREDLINSPLDIVVPGDLDESGLLIVLEVGSRKYMPPVTSGISPVTEEQKRVIREWIEKGAL